MFASDKGRPSSERGPRRDMPPDCGAQELSRRDGQSLGFHRASILDIGHKLV